MAGVLVSVDSVQGSDHDRRRLARWPVVERRALRSGVGNTTIRRASADDEALQAAALEVLTPSDWLEIGAIRHPMMQRRSIASRVLLRRTLSEVHGGRIRPQAWQISRTPEGKPVLAPNSPPIGFSVSYSGRHFVIAASRTHAVGIDIESESTSIDDNVMAAYLGPGELGTLKQLGPDRARQAFIRLWTLKEAYTKLLGTGLATEPSTIEFSLDPVQLALARDVTDQNAAMQFAVWTLQSEGGPLHVSLVVTPLASVDHRHV